jgi:heterodisulfide reductase subunit B
MATDQLKAFAVGARNLALAEGMGDHLVTPCNACFSVLTKVNKYSTEDPELGETVNDALGAAGLHYDGGVTVRHILEVFQEDIPDEVWLDKITKDLTALKLAPYYGCMLTRPISDVDSAEFPTILDDFLRKMGAYVVDYPLKTKCCSGTMVATAPPTANRLIRELLKCAKDNEADAIVCICPLCQFNLDNYQDDVKKQYGEEYDIPVVYFSQIAGLAMGLDPKKLGLDKTAISTKKLSEVNV